jgi:transposase-like protein
LTPLTKIPKTNRKVAKILSTIIKFLLFYINLQEKIISYLLIVILSKEYKTPKKDTPANKKYRKLQVDEKPIFENIQKLDYKKLLDDYFKTNGKELKPVKPRKNSKARVPKSTKCPCCGAPYNYLYDNTGGRGQYKCKVCSSTFNRKNRFSKTVVLKCPYCHKTLEKIKERKDFFIYKCKNNDCSFYQSNLSAMSKEDKEQFVKDPGSFKLRYIYRVFNFDFRPLSKSSPILPKVDLSKIYASPHTLGLILTYYVNYGLSARKTACLMKDVHGLNISHQTILNYADAVSAIVKPYLDNYNYEVSNSFCGDETYIRVHGKWHYIFFFFDAVKKIILSYHVSPNRDTLSAIKALDDVISKLKTIPESLNFVVDGNPIYLLAQHFFAAHDINFDVTQVIGLTNDDPVSKELRPLKQIIERLNRTFKGNYRSTYSFGSSDGSVSYVTLFVAYFNFLRPHSALEKRVPVVIPDLNSLPHMPARWTKLIKLSEEYIHLQQSA